MRKAYFINWDNKEVVELWARSDICTEKSGLLLLFSFIFSTKSESVTESIRRICSTMLVR